MNIREIAKLAGVSPATVSLVLNSKPNVNKDTRARVAMLLEENGYHIKEKAAASKADAALLFLRYKSGTERLESRDDFLVQIMDGVEAQAKALGYALSFASVERNQLAAALAEAAKSYAGIVVFGTELDDQEAELLCHAPIPLCVTDTRLPLYPIHTVSINNYGAIYEALRYLHQQGHNKIGYLHSTVQTGEIPDRDISYRNVMHLLGLEVNPTFVYELDPFLSMAYKQMNAALDQLPELPTAFIADNDMLALGAMQALQQHGLHVPDDVSLIGFDDSHMSSMANPPLTTIRVPKQTMGSAAVRQLHHIITDPTDREIYKIQLGAQLLERSSVMRRR